MTPKAFSGSVSGGGVAMSPGICSAPSTRVAYTLPSGRLRPLTCTRAPGSMASSDRPLLRSGISTARSNTRMLLASGSTDCTEPTS